MKLFRPILLLSIALMFSMHAVQAEINLKKVTNLRVESKTDHSVTLKWKDQPQAKRYQVRVMKKNGDLVYKQFTKKRTLEMTGLKADKIYKFKVRAQAGSVDYKHFGVYSKTIQTRTKEVPVETDTDTSDESTDTDDQNNDNDGDQTDSDEVIPATPTLIGFWGLNGFHSETGLNDIQDRFHSTVFQVASGSGTNYTINTFLPAVKAAGMKVTLRLSGGQNEYTTDGSFDLEKWKTLVSRWEDSGIQSYIDDGTLVGHMLLDDIDTYSVTDASATDLDEMARYSEEIMPGLMTYVRQKATAMPVPADGTYDYLDAVVNQYKSSEGDVAIYAATQAATAEALGVGIINGLNICDGGDGSSGQQGWRADKYAMSADEITSYGEVMLAVPDQRMFLMWEYDGEELWSDGTTIGSDYFDQPELQAALAGLGELAAE